MVNVSWNSIRERAEDFAREWEGETYERGESQSFWTSFLEVFGINRRRAGGYFEYAVRLERGRTGFVDMFLPGKLLAEQKSAGRDLSRAQTQALRYLDGIADHDLPQSIVTSDFRTFQHLNLDTREVTNFGLVDLPKHVKLFAALVDEVSEKYTEQTPVNRKAAEQMAELHRSLDAAGYHGHQLSVLLVRLVFCLFADDSGIFESGSFQRYLTRRTNPDGTDTGPRLIKLFETLATPEKDRSTNLDEDLAAFRYVNGGLFSEHINTPDFDQTARFALVMACQLDWTAVSPAIFGAMFQGVMDETERHDLGAHYTSEENILRAIKPLFLDELYLDFAAAQQKKRAGDRKKALDSLHDRIADLQFLDPACGCGNFLVIAYRELRRLEHKIVAAYLEGTTLVDLDELLRVRVEQFAGIEIEEFPAQIASTALWLTDHQMNREASETLGTHYVRLPLTDGASIVRADALEIDWATVVDPNGLDYVLGNPPFLGSRTMDKAQKSQVRRIAQGIGQAGFLDYVTAWYLKTDKLMDANPAIQAAFVSTNSISQGEQPGILWKQLHRNGTRITFAHRTFRWRNGARGVAAVHCVIVGFGRSMPRERDLYYYPDITGEPVLHRTKSISPYLVPGTEYVVNNREEQISGAPRMAFGNMPADGGNLMLTALERDALLTVAPAAGDWILRAYGAKEFIQGIPRYCLWLAGVPLHKIRDVAAVYARVAHNRDVRAASSRPELADIPHLFAQRTQDPSRPFLIIPGVSSESREYVPMGFFETPAVATNACLAVEGADKALFAFLTSRLHMDWLRTVGGRLKSDFRYSKDVVYNNFVMPALTEEQHTRLTKLADAILDARAAESGATMAALYDPVTMPPALRAAHRAVDSYVDELYHPGGFQTADERVAHLLERHRILTTT